ncbi:per os infectivity factor [Drosophila suzukii associated hytrosavirus 1]|nr:per os infectivity factor [Drosophila suzukii associated hytrosavirus 1]
MYSLIYYIIFVVIFVTVYIIINYLTVSIFNKGKPEFKLKKSTKYRLADNYTYGKTLDKLSDGSLNCTTSADQLIECDIDVNNELGKDAKCIQCKQIASRCVHINQPVYSSSDPDLILIQPNSSPDKGYCLPSVTASKSCTRRNGGKWILIQTNDDINDPYIIYSFECYCSTPNFFQNDTLNGNDCTKFVGCRNGELLPGWSSYEKMRCDCPADLYEEKTGSSNEPPSCILLNAYRRQKNISFDVLDKKYIEPEYLNLLGTSLNLPNPCTFDLTTKTFIKNIGRVVLDESGKIAYCESTHSNYMPMIMNDDYLLGNGGKYANVMFRYRMNDMNENNDDADDNYNDYVDGKMYEIYRRGSNVEHLSGVRLPYYNFPIYLPYLEPDSYNMGNASGRHYHTHPVIPKERQMYAMVYVFEVERPNYTINIVLGNTIQYLPAFMPTSFDTRYRVYNGAIACINIPTITLTHNQKRAFRMIYPNPPAHQFSDKLGTVGIAGELVYPNVTSGKFISGYGFHFIHDGKIEPYTELFTGTIFSYTIDFKVYTRPVSCGDQTLTNKYRQNFDPNWRNIPDEEMVAVPVHSMPHLAITGRDGHMFTHNSYDIERNEVGTTKKTISRYDVSGPRIKFPDFYS